MEMTEIQVLPKADVAEWVHKLHTMRPSMALGTLLAGDRWACVTEVVVAKVEGEIVGIATIAPKGEQMSGEPTIVAIYVSHEHRGRGIGYQLLEAAVDYMLSKGLEPIRLDVLNSKMWRLIARLPAEKRQKLNVVDLSMGGIIDAVMEV
ncbi:MAG: hypothetical protein DDT21_02548 [Syntrophomonadaceae bacterium]|nr:hypothetical protein [Bacillota bacterium]